MVRIIKIIRKTPLLLIITCATATTAEAQPITTRSECLQFVERERPVCIRKGSFPNLEICVCGRDEQDFQENCRADPQPAPPPLDYSKCTEDPRTGILHCPEDFLPLD